MPDGRSPPHLAGGRLEVSTPQNAAVHHYSIVVGPPVGQAGEENYDQVQIDAPELLNGVPGHRRRRSTLHPNKSGSCGPSLSLLVVQMAA
jgi:hypothetical protein